MEKAEPTEGAKPAPVWNLYPIQLRFVHLSHLSFEAREIPENLPKEERAGATPGFLSAAVESDVGDGRATVASRLSLLFRDQSDEGEPESTPPADKDAAPADQAGDYYSLEVAVVAGFSYDPKEMQKEKVKEWCQKGSLFIVLPYIRSIVATITGESGFPVVSLPLLEVPTFRPPDKVKPHNSTRPEPGDESPAPTSAQEESA